MRCPFCHCDNDRVCDSRAVQDGFAIRRRRECQSCHRRFTTQEQVAEMSIKVIKKDDGRVPFDREKLKRGLQRACWKRPISEDQIEAIVGAVEADVYAQFDSEVESQFLGEKLMERLRQLDQVAYVRFASVYRQFEDVHDFVEELQPMLKENKRRARNTP